jgi:hypothetical protein
MFFETMQVKVFSKTYVKEIYYPLYTVTIYNYKNGYFQKLLWTCVYEPKYTTLTFCKSFSSHFW